MLQIDSPELDKMFEALSSPKRRGIITTLSYRPATISQLSKEWDMSLPAIHKTPESAGGGTADRAAQSRPH